MDGCVINVPSICCLSSLTVLNLSGITLANYSSNNSEKLTLNFPVFRKYETKNCAWSGVKSVTLVVPLLELVSTTNLDYRLLSDKSHTEIKFCASRIASFHYSGYTLSETILLVAHIGSAVINVLTSTEKSVQDASVFVCKLLNNNVAECLKLKFYDLQRTVTDDTSIEAYNEVLVRANDSFAGKLGFGMLSRLELPSVTGEILLGLLSKSPCLKTLVFKKLLDFDELLQNYAIVPKCFLCTLKVVKFGGLDGDVYELCFAKFVMKNAQVWERISFSCGSKLRGSNFEKVKEKLISFKKSLSFAVIEFSSV